MSDPQEAATPSDPHSAEAPVWRDAWRTFQDPYLGPDTEKFPSPFESFVAGYMAAVRSRDAEVAELKAKIAESQAIVAELLDPDPCNWDHNHSCQAHGFYYIPQGETCPNERGRQYLAASSPVEGG